MKSWAKLILVLIVLAVMASAYGLRGAATVAVGYSAKQLCSGVFVAGLPESFVRERDIEPRMSILGPALSLLEVKTESSTGTVSSRLFGVEATATHRTGLGCTLHWQGAGDPAMGLPMGGELSPTLPQLVDAMEAAFSEPAEAGRNTLALIASVKGERVMERYLPPVTAQTRMQSWSMNKSLMATWIGMRSERGLIDPTIPVASTARGEAVLSALDPRLTLLHLLQMESGLDFEEKYCPGSDVTRMLYAEQAMWKVPAESPQAYSPGTRFAYSSGDTVLASYIWQRELRRPYQDWIAQEFAQPLGLESLVAESDACGVQVGSSYVHMTARDWLRVGQLWLDAWHGRSDLLSQTWLRASVSARPSDKLGRYGRGFWLNTHQAVFPGVPDNAFYAGGNAGQYVVVVPEWELVLVRLGLSAAQADTGVATLLQEIQARLDSMGVAEVIEVTDD
ncbi:MAG: serine hydrolase [Congregibacter sp.]